MAIVASKRVFKKQSIGANRTYLMQNLNFFDLPEMNSEMGSKVPFFWFKLQGLFTLISRPGKGLSIYVLKIIPRV